MSLRGIDKGGDLGYIYTCQNLFKQIFRDPMIFSFHAVNAGFFPGSEGAETPAFARIHRMANKYRNGGG